MKSKILKPPMRLTISARARRRRSRMCVSRACDGAGGSLNWGRRNRRKKVGVGEVGGRKIQRRRRGG
eukprot:407065-Rhodomonas_salina.1